MSDDKLFDDLHRGSQAKGLLDSELLKECFAYLDALYVDAWRRSPARDVIQREKLWQAVNVVGLVHSHLIKVLNDGKLAQADLSMRQKKAA